MPEIIADKYEVIETIGRGGMGTVYKAFQRSMDRIVAVKMLSEDLASDPEFRTRFQQEGQGLGKLSHPNIVSVYDIEPHKHTFCIIMEYLEGETLQAKIDRDGALPEAMIVGLGTQVARALNYAHSRGIIHRDIKPDNIYVTPDGVAKVMDFGIARFRESKLKTQTGISMGTPKFMSPEQVTGKHIDAQTDIYALGVCLYYCLAGQVPFDGENPIAIATRHLYDQPVAPSHFNPAITHETEKVILRAMEKNKLERYATANDLADALEACLAARPQVRLTDDDTGLVSSWGATRRMPSTPPSAGEPEVLVNETPLPGDTPSGIRRVSDLLAAEREAAGNHRPTTEPSLKALAADGAAGAHHPLTPAGLLRRWWPAAAALILVAAGVTIAVRQQGETAITQEANGSGKQTTTPEEEFRKTSDRESVLVRNMDYVGALKVWSDFRQRHPSFQQDEISSRVEFLASREKDLLAKRRLRRGDEFSQVKSVATDILAKAYYEGARDLCGGSERDKVATQLAMLDTLLTRSLELARTAGRSGRKPYELARTEGKWTTATESHLIEALMCEPENMLYLQTLAEYYDAQGRIDDARVIFEYIRRHAPSGPVAIHAKQELRRLEK